jgi:uncharacterized protein
VKRAIQTAAALGVWAIALSGCGGFSAMPDPTRFFTLSALTQENISTKPDHEPSGISLGIGPTTLPGYLDRQEIVTRVAPNRIALSENDRWAEPLGENFARVLAQNVAAILRAGRIHVYPWPSDKRPAYQVEVEVLRFEVDMAQAAQLAVRWSVRNTGNKNSIRYRESRLTRRAEARNMEASVAALSAVLADLSREIAEAIEQIDGN